MVHCPPAVHALNFYDSSITNDKGHAFMRYKLFECVFRRQERQLRIYIIANTEQQARKIIGPLDRSRGKGHNDFSVERIDRTLPFHLRDGLEEMLENAPPGFASHTDFGWVAHSTTMQRLNFYHGTDARAGLVYAVAPNAQVAAALFANTMLPDAEPHVFAISEGVECLPEEMTSNVAELLELGPVGIAEWDDDAGRWFVW